MKINPLTHEAYQLLHDGVLALADAEEFGFTVDVDYCKRVKIEIADEKAEVEKDFWKSELGKGWKSWARRTHVTASLQSDQLADVFKHMKVGGGKKTATGRISTDEESLKSIEINGAEQLLQMRKMEKASGTYLNQLLNEVVDEEDGKGVVHPMFSLNIPKTYRSSCSNPSIQNFPIRDPWQGKIIRSAIIPRSPDRHLVESDFSGLEVCVAACYNKDPVLMAYIEDSSLDMHRDMAMKCFMLELEEVHKWTRHAAKNMFVFPEFYGSYYEECAKNLWKRSPHIHLEGEEDYSVRQHLMDQGLTTLARYTKHIQKVEDFFWNEQFKVYTKWKRKHYNSYLQKGYVDSLTGFRFTGDMKRTEVINYPIQGAAFHANLWCFIETNKALKKYKMKSKIIGQIHDSIIGDVLGKELKDYYDITQEIACEKLAKAWDWINVRMSIEVEVAPLGASWYEKKEMML